MRDASTQYFPYMFEYDVDLMSFFKPVDCGDVPIVPGNNDRSHEYIYQYITECLEGGAKVIFCGGDHSAPIPGALALSDYHKDGKIGYLHIDCHLDSAPDWGGILNTNCSGPSRAFELPNCDGANMAHMGSRNGLNPKDWYDFFVDNDVRVIPMMEAVELGLRTAPGRSSTSPGTAPTRSIVPGIRTRWMPAACRARRRRNASASSRARPSKLARIAGTYGADVLEISELCPIFDVSQMSIKLACCMIYHYLGSRAKTLRDKGEAP